VDNFTATRVKLCSPFVPPPSSKAWSLSGIVITWVYPSCSVPTRKIGWRNASDRESRFGTPARGHWRLRLTHAPATPQPVSQSLGAHNHMTREWSRQVTTGDENYNLWHKKVKTWWEKEKVTLYRPRPRRQLKTQTIIISTKNSLDLNAPFSEGVSGLCHCQVIFGLDGELVLCLVNWSCLDRTQN